MSYSISLGTRSLGSTVPGCDGVEVPWWGCGGQSCPPRDDREEGYILQNAETSFLPPSRQATPTITQSVD